MSSQQELEKLKDRLDALDTIQKEVINCVAYAGQTLTELGKDKPPPKAVDQLAGQFVTTLSRVENDLFDQIKYLTQVSTGQAHEGSSYASQKTLQMAWHRVMELDRIKQQHMARPVSQVSAQPQTSQQQNVTSQQASQQ